jgi:hypothetical protein
MHPTGRDANLILTAGPFLSASLVPKRHRLADNGDRRPWYWASAATRVRTDPPRMISNGWVLGISLRSGGNSIPSKAIVSAHSHNLRVAKAARLGNSGIFASRSDLKDCT